MLESFRLLVKDKATTKISAGIAILTSVQNLGYYGIMIWMPAYLAKQLGFGLTKSAMWTTVTILGMMAGIWVLASLPTVSEENLLLFFSRPVLRYLLCFMHSLPIL
jgi:hypothetical protein